jgi:hypothetical protein
MTCRLWTTAALALAILASGAVAYDDDDVNKKLAKLVDLGPGVHKVKTNKRGEITSCVVIGQARISTVLGKTKGVMTARTQARLAAVAEFRKWLKENVSVYEKSENEAIMVLEGKEGAGEDSLKEAGKAVEKTSTRYESFAQGVVRGMQIVHVDVNAEDKQLTLVLGWDRATSEATKKVASDLEDDTPGGKGGTPGKKTDKTIKTKKSTSDEAKKFID